MANNVPQTLPPDGDVNLKGLLTGFLIALDLLATLFVAMRIVTRSIIVKSRLWWDDVFIVLANVRFRLFVFNAILTCTTDLYINGLGYQPRKNLLWIRQT